MGTKVKGDGHYGNEGEIGQTLRERRSKGMEAADDGWVSEGEGPFSQSHSV